MEKENKSTQINIDTVKSKNSVFRGRTKHILALKCMYDIAIFHCLQKQVKLYFYYLSYTYYFPFTYIGIRRTVFFKINQ